MPPYQLHEPFPALATSRPTYMHTGRGGAGNISRATPTDVTARNPSTASPISRTSSHTSLTSSHPSSTASHTPSTHKSSTFLSGRGGAGNAHPLSERALFSFDEELERLSNMECHAAPVYYIGRGGAGNRVAAKEQGWRGGSLGWGSRKGSSCESQDEEGEALGLGLGQGLGRRSLEWVRRLGRGGEERRGWGGRGRRGHEFED
ncbi:MAG: hypothetical protein MMC23_003172 [Stictis urceolatum]|nr:hypothetical protein [Stictis urceolata]